MNSLKFQLRSAVSWSVGLGCISNLLIVFVPVYTIVVYDRVLLSKNVDTLIWMSALAAGLLATYAITDAVRAQITMRAACRFEEEAVAELAKVADQAARRGYFIGTEPISDVKSVKQFLLVHLPLLLDIPWALLFLGFLFLLHPVLGTAGVFMVTLLMVTGLAQRAAVSKGVTPPPTFAGIFSGSNDVLRLSAGVEPAEQWVAAFRPVAAEELRYAALNTFAAAVAKTLRQSAAVMMVGLGAWLVIRNELSVGGLLAASILSGRMMGPFDRLRPAVAAFRQAMSGWKAIVRFLDASGSTRITDCDAALAEAPAVVAHNIHFRSASGSVLLQPMSLHISAAAAVAIVGPPRSGKSLLLSLLAGAERPTTGSIRVGGIEADRVRHTEIFYAAEHTGLVAGSVAENIVGYGSDRELDPTIMAKLGLTAWIAHLPKGAETRVEDIPHTLMSYSVTKAILIARAFANPAKMRLIDGIDRGLDVHIEQAVLDLIAEARRRGETVIYTCQKQSFVQTATMAIGIKEGKTELIRSAGEMK